MAIQVTSEERMRLKARARQRLLGAVVLLIATAIILPLLLDQAPRPLNADVVIDMPETGASKKSAVLPPVTTIPGNFLAPSPAPVLMAAHPDNQPAADKLASEGKTVAPVTLNPTASLAPHKSAETKPAVVKSVNGKEKIPSAQLAVNSPSASVKAVKIQHDAKPVASPKLADVHTRYVVQLGAFSSAANVRQLCARLKGAGVATYTEVLPSGSTRVRAGPFPDYAQADKTLAKISMVGIQAQIVPLSH